MPVFHSEEIIFIQAEVAAHQNNLDDAVASTQKILTQGDDMTKLVLVISS